MELKSLVLGILFSLGIFAVKSGAGLAYLLRRESKSRKGAAIVGGFVLGYGLLFTLAWFTVSHLDLLAHLNTVTALLANGMILHVLLAALLLLWGQALLRTGAKSPETSRGWLLLALPCPVCFSVILFTGAFLNSLLPDTPWIFVWLFAGFLVVSLLSGVGFSLFGKEQPEQGLGRIMALTALYFLLSVAMAPQFGDLERIYRLSQPLVLDDRLALLGVGVILLFSLGVMSAYRRKS